MRRQKEIELDENFKEFIGLLNSKKVRYLLVGGFAVGLHGYPRYTGDFDVWVDPVEENARRIIEVFSAFGFSSLKLHTQDFCTADMVHQFGYPPLRIDVLTGISGLKFVGCYSRKKRMKVGGVWINVLSFNDLKRNKRASGRPEDLYDVQKLEQINSHGKKGNRRKR